MGRPKEITDEQIVAAARRCFLERGAGVSASDIAHEFGVSDTTILNHFGSKVFSKSTAVLRKLSRVAFTRQVTAACEPDSLNHFF
jgi:AcrR family transcriptional regulator